MNIKQYRNDVSPGYLVWRAYVAQQTREALEHPPRVTFFDKAIMVFIILGLGWLTVAILRWVVRP